MQALLHSYSCLDFASILDVTQLRLYRLRKLMKDRVQNRQALPSLSIVGVPEKRGLTMLISILHLDNMTCPAQPIRNVAIARIVITDSAGLPSSQSVWCFQVPQLDKTFPWY